MCDPITLRDTYEYEYIGNGYERNDILNLRWCAALFLKGRIPQKHGEVAISVV